MTEAEKERIILLMEECAEVTQRCAKILRFGWDSVQPSSGRNNRDLLEQETGDFMLVFSILTMNNDIDLAKVEKHSHNKIPKLNAHMKYNKYEPS